MNWWDANYLPWLIPLPPLIAFALIVLLLGRSRLATHVTAIGAMALSWFLSFAVVLRAIDFRDLGMATRGVFGSSISWLANGTSGGATAGALTMGVMVDPLTAIMLFMVPLACLMIFIYSLGYMAHDSRNPRFFAYLCLFAGAMLTLVVSDNLLMLFVGWEVMGLCSYLLIGFWYDRSPESQTDKVAPYQAAIKAFLTTRAADVILMIGIAGLWAFTGTLNFRQIMFNEETMKALGSVPALGGFLGLTVGGLIGVCIVTGTVGKSAQFPLHVWLPDAMKGPTPVSAMIHAAAMVSAGIYMLLRMFPVLSAGAHIEEGLLSSPMIYMAVIGSLTALFAATIAITQNDIKKVLAYSTVSQLGFMVAALGIGAYAAAAFHLITHAFFKALLFMGSGSVIHAVEHGHHVAHGHGGHDEAHGDAHGHEEHAESHHDHEAHETHGAVVAASHDAHGHEEHGHEAAHEEQHGEEFDPQDMRNMGGLLRNMPVTGLTFIIGGMSLAGLPLITAGFWSKDEILLEALTASAKNPLGILVLISLSLAAVLTAVYTIRQIVMTFLGSPRTEAAVHAQHYNHKRGDGASERYVSVTMTAPLIVLSFFAIVAGFVGINPAFPVLGPIAKNFGLDQPFILYVERALMEEPGHPPFNLLAVIFSFTIFIVGATVGYVLYMRKPIVLGQPDPVEDIVGPDVYRVLKNKYYIDEFYARWFIAPMRWLANTFTNQILDKGLIDGVIHFFARLAGLIGDMFKEFNRVVIDGVGDGIPAVLGDLGRGLRPMQTGRIQQYLLFALIAALVVGVNLVILALAPGAALALLLIQGGAFVLLIVLLNANRPHNSASSGD